MFTYLRQIFHSKDLRNKILFTLGILVLYRVLAHITVPGVNLDALRALEASKTQNDLVGMFSMLTGGGTETFSIVLMGISPYINASIIIQLLTVVIPKLEDLSKEGEQGRKKIASITRWLTLPLAFLQSYGMIALLNATSGVDLIHDMTDISVVLPIMLTISAGTVLLVWLGELITEKGIGNGISLLIFANIIAQIPLMIGQSLYGAAQDSSKLIPFAAMIIITIILITIVVLVNEGQRRIPVTYAGRGVKAKSAQSFLPIRINQAGMIPIIFAVAMVSFPGILGQFLARGKSGTTQTIGEFMEKIFLPGTSVYMLMYFLLVIAFTYFYVSITFKPQDVGESIQKRGGYIPGIRPGKQTTEFIAKTSSRLTLFGAVFLGLIAVFPMILQYAFATSGYGSVTLLISGAGIIIIVGVVLELIRQINSMLVMHDYKKFY